MWETSDARSKDEVWANYSGRPRSKNEAIWLDCLTREEAARVLSALCGRRITPRALGHVMLRAYRGDLREQALRLGWFDATEKPPGRGGENQIVGFRTQGGDEVWVQRWRWGRWPRFRCDYRVVLETNDDGLAARLREAARQAEGKRR